MSTPHGGAERRIHKVYVTRNTEYHVRREVCVAVRDRRTGRWVEGHAAIGKRLEGSLRLFAHGFAPNAAPPAAGDAIYFRNGERDLITSKLECVERPARDVVQQYQR